MCDEYEPSEEPEQNPMGDFLGKLLEMQGQEQTLIHLGRQLMKVVQMGQTGTELGDLYGGGLFAVAITGGSLLTNLGNYTKTVHEALRLANAIIQQQNTIIGTIQEDGEEWKRPRLRTDFDEDNIPF